MPDEQAIPTERSYSAPQIDRRTPVGPGLIGIVGAPEPSDLPPPAPAFD